MPIQGPRGRPVVAPDEPRPPVPLMEDDVKLVRADPPQAHAPQGAANVRGLIKTLFPVTTPDPGLMVPLTAESRVLLCLPVPPDLATKPGQGIEGN